jgi:protein-disulfide isomerase
MKIKPQILSNVYVLILLSGALLLTSACGKITKYPASAKVNKTEVSEVKSENVSVPNIDNLEKQESVKPIAKEDNLIGNLEAPVQIIVYSDFSCPFCSDFKDTMDIVKKEFAGKTVIAFRHFFISSHINAFPAALASECAGEQGKFWEMHDKLFELNKSNSLSAENYGKSAKEIVLDEKKFNNCLIKGTYKEKIAKSVLDAKSIGVIGTPTVFVNGDLLTGAYPMEDFTGNDGQKYEGLRKIINKKLESLNKN